MRLTRPHRAQSCRSERLTVRPFPSKSAPVTSERGLEPIRPGDAWSSRTEREYFITVVRPSSRSGWWVVADNGTERDASEDEIVNGFVLDQPWAR